MQTATANGGGGNTFRFYIPLAKIDEEKRMCYGYASTDTRDSDGDVITRKAIETALPDYLKWSNIREMHQLSAVGTTETSKMDGKGLYIGAKIIDDSAWNKVKAKVYKGFSIGGRATKRAEGDPSTITGLELVEISLVDRPANPDAKIDTFKMFKGNEDLSKAAVLQMGVDPTPDVEEDDGETPLPSVEEKALALCKAAGKDPEAILAYSKNGAHVMVWHTFRKAASDELTAMQMNREIAKRQKAVEKAADSATPKPRQLWACGMLTHAHSTQDEAQACMADCTLDDTAKAARLALAKGIDGLDAEGLAAAAGHLDKADKKKAKGDAKPDDSGGADDGTGDGTDDEDDDPNDRKNPDEPKGGDKAKKADDSSKPYGDVAYADPGYQADKQKRYPIETEGHIRAAWSFINKSKNQATYTPKQVAAIKGRIVSAWKAKIDSAGPASVDDGKGATITNKTEDTVNTDLLKAFGAPDAKGSIKKGLYAASVAIGYLAQTENVSDVLGDEKTVAKADAPERLVKMSDMVSELFKTLIAEEIESLLANEEFGKMKAEDVIEMAGSVLKAASPFCSKDYFGKTLEAAIGDSTGDPGWTNLDALVDFIAKDGTAGPQTAEWGSMKAKPDANDKWTQKVQNLHDDCVQMGASCTEKAGKKDPKADPEDMADGGADEDAENENKKKKKAAAAKAAKAAKDKADGDGDDDDDDDKGESLLVKTLTSMQEQLDAMGEQLAGRVNPKRRGADGKVISKTKEEDDGDGDNKDDGKDTLGADGKVDPQKVLRKALGRPQYITR